MSETQALFIDPSWKKTRFKDYAGTVYVVYDPEIGMDVAKAYYFDTVKEERRFNRDCRQRVAA